MSRFNTRAAKPAVASPIQSTGEHTTTYEGGIGHLRDARSELFLLAVTNMVGQDTFYETGGQRDDRYTQLVRQLAVEDPEWVAQMLGWLRRDGNMRTAAIVGAAEYVKARLDAAQSRERRIHEQGADAASTVWSGDSLSYSIAANRRVIASVLQRADEPGELLAYWTSRYGRRIPKPVKRGIEDALGDLYTERALVKYDAPGRAFRFGDVVELVHPAPKALWQGDLFEHAIDRRHQRDKAIPDSLQTLHARNSLMALPLAERRALLRRSDADFFLREAAMTWEALAGWLQGPMDAAAWSAIIPSMGHMALLRNLRNFDEAGVSDEVAQTVAARIADRGQVEQGRQFPFRYLAAYQAAPSLRWGHALETALGYSLGNVPVLPGRTLVLVDRSGSMFGGVSERTQLNRADSAAVFGTAVALRAEAADLVEFGSRSQAVQVRKAEPVLSVLKRFHDLGGTNTTQAVREHFAGHDRVLIVTDEQAAYSFHGDPTEQVPAAVPVYTWNLAGYRAGHGPSGSGNRHTFGGLTDAAFRMVPFLEAGRNARWPWEN